MQPSMPPDGPTATTAPVHEPINATAATVTPSLMTGLTVSGNPTATAAAPLTALLNPSVLLEQQPPVCYSCWYCLLLLLLLLLLLHWYWLLLLLLLLLLNWHRLLLLLLLLR